MKFDIIGEGQTNTTDENGSSVVADTATVRIYDGKDIFDEVFILPAPVTKQDQIRDLVAARIVTGEKTTIIQADVKESDFVGKEVQLTEAQATELNLKDIK